METGNSTDTVFVLLTQLQQAANGRFPGRRVEYSVEWFVGDEWQMKAAWYGGRVEPVVRYMSGKTLPELLARLREGIAAYQRASDELIPPA